MSKIEKAKNHNGETIFPVTVADAVLMGNGQTLKGKLSELGSKVDKQIGDNLINPNAVTRGKAIQWGGTVVSVADNYYISDYIPVSSEGIITNAFLTENSWNSYLVYDKNKQVINGREGKSKQYTYSEGDAYIRISFNSTPAYANYGTTLIRKEYTELKPIQVLEEETTLIKEGLKVVDDAVIKTNESLSQEKAMVEAEIYDNIKFKLTHTNIIQDSYIDDGGNIKQASGIKIKIYELDSNKTFKYNHFTGLAISSICLFEDASCENFVSTLFTGTDNKSSYYKNNSGKTLYLGFSSMYEEDIVEELDIKPTLKAENIKGIIDGKSFDVETFTRLFQYDEIKQTSTMKGSSYINDKGEIKNSGSEWNIFIFNVNEGEKYHIKGSTGNNAFSVAFYSDSSLSNLVGIVKKETAKFDMIVCAPKGAAVIAITNNYDFDQNHLVYLLSVTKVKNDIGLNAIQEPQIEQEFVRASCNTNERIINGTTIDGYYINVITGTPVANSDYHYQKYPIEAGKIYHLSGFLGVTNDKIGIGIYNSEDISSDSFVRNLHSGVDSYDIYFRAKDGESYLAITDLYLSNVTKLVEVLPNDSNRLVMCWGDSLTYSGGTKLAYNYGHYPNKLQELLPHYEVINAGEGGDTCETLLSRQQGFVVDADFVLYADRTQKSVITFKYAKPLQQFQVIDMVNPCYIDGIQCTITHSADGNYYIQRKTNGTLNRNIPKGTFVTTNGLKNYNHPKVLIAFIGTNNGFTSAEEWRDIIIDTYEKIRITSGCERMVVVSTHKGVWDGNDINNLKVVEEGLLQKYGARYINWRLYVSTNAIYDAGLTPTQEDLDAMAEGWCPPQLLKDSVHLTEVGYELLATYIYNRLVELGDVTLQ